MHHVESKKAAHRLSGADASTLKKISGYFPFWAIGAACVVAYYLLNINTPPFGDDIALVFKFPDVNDAEFNFQRVSGIKDIIIELAGYYMLYRGRVIAEGLEILFAVYGKQYFNFLNSLVFVGMTSLVYFHSNYGKRTNWRLYLIICVIFWFLTPNMSSTYLWMVVSLYTVWPIFFILLFLIPYRMLLSEKCEVKSWASAKLFLIPAGFLAGAFNEQSFGLSIGFVVLTIIILAVKKKEVPAWSKIGLFSVVFGTISLYLSPGYRTNCQKDYGNSPMAIYLQNFFDRILGAVQYSLWVTRVLLLFTAIVFIWLIVDSRKAAKKLRFKNKQKGKIYSFKSLDDNNILFIPGLFFITTVASSAIASVLPYFEYRLFFTVFVSFSLVFFCLLADALNRMDISRSEYKKARFNKYLRIAFPVIISLFTVLDFGKEYKTYHQHFEVYTNIVASIKEKVAAGEKDIVIRNKTEIPQLLLPERRLQSIIYNWTITSLSEDPNATLNKLYAYYLGANTLKGELKESSFSIKDGHNVY